MFYTFIGVCSPVTNIILGVSFLTLSFPYHSPYIRTDLLISPACRPISVLQIILILVDFTVENKITPTYWYSYSSSGTKSTRFILFTVMRLSLYVVVYYYLQLGICMFFCRQKLLKSIYSLRKQLFFFHGSTKSSFVDMPLYSRQNLTRDQQSHSRWQGVSPNYSVLTSPCPIVIQNHIISFTPI